MRYTHALALFVAVCCLSSAPAAAACPKAAYLTYEQGALAGVDWVTYASSQVDTRSELTQSAIIRSIALVRADGSVSKTSTTVTMAGSKPSDPKVRTFHPGEISWSDMVPTSLQLALDRARAIGAYPATVEAGSLFSSTTGEISVGRVDATDWTIAYHGKTYLVLTDSAGCVVSASLPEFGVTIERRSSFAQSAYPMWAPYAAPPDHAYDAVDVSIPASGGVNLAGTLTRPPHRTLVPAAVLITGLSPHERNNGLPPWMPFRDIADALARGIRRPSRR